MNILVINCGSSSLKYRLFDDNGQRAKGQIERIGQDDVTPDHTRAVQRMLEQITAPDTPGRVDLEDIQAIGHRVVHGGDKLTESVLIDRDVIATIDACIPLGPLHNPANLQGIRACLKLIPHAKQVAVFDTGFHQTMPDYAYTYAIAEDLRQKYGIRRYGFHGTSHLYVSREVEKELAAAGVSGRRIVCCHLGNGSSIAAVKDGKCIDTSMGMTPSEGLMMGTRCGDIDPAALIFMMRTLNYDADRLDRVINKEGGLLAVAGMIDMRDVEDHAAAGDYRCTLALNMFCYRVLKYIGAYTAAMNGIDALAFAGGIGENSPEVRQRVCSQLSYLGLEIDPQANDIKRTRREISTPSSKVKVWIITTDEELVIAQETRRLVEAC